MVHQLLCTILAVAVCLLQAAAQEGSHVPTTWSYEDALIDAQSCKKFPLSLLDVEERASFSVSHVSPVRPLHAFQR